MNRPAINYVIDIGLAVCIITAFATGLTKFPGLLHSIGINRSFLPTAQINTIHDWIGIIMGILGLAHLLLHWRWIVEMTKKYLKK